MRPCRSEPLPIPALTGNYCITLIKSCQGFLCYAYSYSYGTMKRNKHARKPSKAKGEQAKGEQHDDGFRWKPAAAHAASNGWVQNSGVAFLGAIILLVVAMATSTGTKAAVITAACAGTAFLWIFAIALIKYISEPNIVVAKKVLFVSTTGDIRSSGPFWIRYRSPLGDTLSPLPVSMYIAIHNGQSVPLKIERLWVSMQAKGHDWLQLTHVNAEAGQVFWIGNDLKHARPLDNQNPMIDILIQKPIAANSPVEGWLFFSVNEKYATTPGTLLRFKYLAKDSSGKTMEYTSHFEETQANAPADNGSAGEDIGMHVGTITDLSCCHVFQWWQGGIIPVPDKAN